MGRVVAFRGRQTASSAERTIEHPVSHALSLHLTRTQYRRLRRFAIYQEYITDRRITHQSILEAALDEYLDRHNRLSPDH
jgi:hypothetical protein